MHLFDKVDLKQTQTSFYITIVLVSLLTWIISASFIWGVNKRQKGKGEWKNIWMNTAPSNDSSGQNSNSTTSKPGFEHQDGTKERAGKGKKKQQDAEMG
jgi:hypothetical protein